MSVNTLDYSSGDLASLGRDETLLWQWDPSPGRPSLGKRVMAALRVLVGALFLAMILFGPVLIVFSGAPAVVAVLVIGVLVGSVTLLRVRDRLSAAPGSDSIRATNHRLIRGMGSNLTQWPLESATQYRLRQRLRGGSDENEVTVSSASIDDDAGDTVIAWRKMPIALARERLDDLMRRGFERRVADRRREVAWRSGPAAVTSGAMGDGEQPLLAVPASSAGTIAPERELWSGRPQLKPAADFRNHARLALSKIIWASIALGMILLPIVVPALRQASGILVMLLGLLILGFWLNGFVWRPFREHRVLRHTHYRVTTRRLVIRIESPRSVTEHSVFFDSTTAVTLTELPDGRGTIRFDYNYSLALIPDARQVYLVLTDAVNGARLGVG